MRRLEIDIDDWEQAALAELAEARGVAVETIARWLLSEKLLQRAHTTFDDLLLEPGAIGPPPPERTETIEQRLARLFGE